jgi:hypothetical protein
MDASQVITRKFQKSVTIGAFVGLLSVATRISETASNGEQRGGRGEAADGPALW